MSTPTFNSPRKFWSEPSEAALNWVALGLLLAAWNACDNEQRNVPQRPQSLQAHAYVSVRAYKGHETVNEL